MRLELISCMVIFILLLSLTPALTENSSVLAERELYKTLFDDYNKDIMPKVNRSEPMTVYMSVALRAVDEVDERKQALTFRSFIGVLWKDEVLNWNPDLYSNITHIYVNEDLIWIPSVTLIDSVESSFRKERVKRTVAVDNEGHAQVYTYEKYTIQCEFDITRFPFESQTCSFLFEPWHNTASELSLARFPNTSGVDVTKYKANSAWTLTETNFTTLKSVYAGGSLFSSIQITLTLKRKYLFHVLYTVLPVLFTSVLGITCFLLPTENGERVSLSVSLFLALAVLITIVNTNMPETSEQVAVFGLYVALQLFWSGLTVFMTSISANLYFKKGTGNIYPKILQLLIFGKFAKKSRNSEQSTASDNASVTEDLSSITRHESIEKSRPHGCPNSDDVDEKSAWKSASKRLDKICITVTILWHLIMNIVLSVSYLT